MENHVGLERCLTYINCHVKPGAEPAASVPAGERYTAVTISRQAGCGARIVADQLAAVLQASAREASPPWTVFDRNLMDKVLEDHHLPARLAQYLPEDRKTELQDIMDEIVGLRPASWTIVRQTTETILQLAELGHVILIGRGGNVITAKLPNVFHVRLVAPFEQRVEHAREFYNLGPRQARDFCQREDQGRKRYLKKYFDADMEDAQLYHLTINTGLVSYDEATRLIAEAMLGPRRKTGH